MKSRQFYSIYTQFLFQSDGQKTMALNLPQKLTLTMPAHIAQSGLQTIVVSWLVLCWLFIFVCLS